MTAEILYNAILKAGYHARNWSFPGTIYFAVYTETDSFIGAVGVENGRIVEGTAKWDRKDQQILAKIKMEASLLESQPKVSES